MTSINWDTVYFYSSWENSGNRKMTEYVDTYRKIYGSSNVNGDYVKFEDDPDIEFDEDFDAEWLMCDSEDSP